MSTTTTYPSLIREIWAPSIHRPQTNPLKALQYLVPTWNFSHSLHALYMSWSNPNTLWRILRFSICCIHLPFVIFVPKGSKEPTSKMYLSWKLWRSSFVIKVKGNENKTHFHYRGVVLVLKEFKKVVLFGHYWPWIEIHDFNQTPNFNLISMQIKPMITE